MTNVPCPHCHATTENRVVKTRVRVALIYRRRECVACGFRYSTTESIGARAYTQTPLKAVG